MLCCRRDFADESKVSNQFEFELIKRKLSIVLCGPALIQESFKRELILLPVQDTGRQGFSFFSFSEEACYPEFYRCKKINSSKFHMNLKEDLRVLDEIIVS